MGQNWTPPKPTHYTLREGGDWNPWVEKSHDAGEMFSILFDNGWIFDTSYGWRRQS